MVIADFLRPRTVETKTQIETSLFRQAELKAKYL